MFKDDMTRLRHMLDAAREAISVAQSCVRSDLAGQRLLLAGHPYAIQFYFDA